MIKVRTLLGYLSKRELIELLIELSMLQYTSHNDRARIILDVVSGSLEQKMDALHESKVSTFQEYQKIEKVSSRCFAVQDIRIGQDDLHQFVEGLVKMCQEKERLRIEKDDREIEKYLFDFKRRDQ